MEALLDAVAIGGLVLAGGDTAQGVLAGARADGIALGTEVQPGILLGTIIGGRMDGKPVATKAGGFGTEDSLAQVLQQCGTPGAAPEARQHKEGRATGSPPLSARESSPGFHRVHPA